MAPRHKIINKLERKKREKDKVIETERKRERDREKEKQASTSAYGPSNLIVKLCLEHVIDCVQKF